MRELSSQEVAAVSGGVNPLMVLGMAGGFFVFGYGMGKDLAQRDNAAQRAR
ncbi:class IIb bacteriocin, lactobin A/cerein 7B family [Stenotrophomonas sp. HITSZ_GD]|uniref:class IIb bacteriocin, lactobin A/cerein 7B family n=1 Tax=Stenotrophomonas sp. HITSZ_GD TaxID=3037248 RepID=UPI00240E7D9B|nr:class IIb bacteriocin, lactobin A/cerein 7B family [Stenotrophomonas sp. HITSZ_GD]MDG2525245.1 class IIb bacteriocin, lactobin A/cerein 7B family [Stenotrophomonas sp. HITSZ_GD]